MDTPGFNANRLIRKSGSWVEYLAAIALLTKKQKGDAFERLVQLYLQPKIKAC